MSQARRSPTFWPLLCSLALAAGATVWFFSQLRGPWGPPLLGWAFPLLSSCAAAWACLRTGRLPGITPDAGRFWRRFAAALVIMAMAIASNARETALRTEGFTQRNSVIGLCLYGAGTLAAILAVLRLPGLSAQARLDPKRFRLDAAIVILTTALFIWHFSFRDVLVQADRVSALTALAVLLAGSLITLALAKVALTGPGPVDPAALGLMSLAVASGVLQGAMAPLVADRPWLYLTEIGYPLTVLMITLGAHRQCRAVRRQQARARRRGRFSLLPYLAVAATDALLLTTRGDGVEAVLVAACVVVLTGVVVLRQITALRENERLLARIDDSVAELHRSQERLAYQATHDSVTGLANRNLFEQRLGEALDGSAPVALALVDLDDFKAINDRFGHLAGDQLLRTIGERLLACTRTGEDAGVDDGERPADTVARLGGDEFAVLLRGVTGEVAGSILDRFRKAVAEPVRAEGEELSVGVSIGLAEAWPDARPEQLLRRADLAMYSAKRSGKGRLRHYRSDLELQDTARARIAAELRTALMDRQFRLVFQPIVRLPDGAAVGAEALIRWDHPEHDAISPTEFIPVAERTGLIVPLGAWILHEACSRAADWLRGQDSPVSWRLSVNVSDRQLREPGFAELVAGCLEQTGLPAARLVVEVGEPADGDHRVLRELRAVADLGVLVALDNFGVGQSSLALLRTLPVHVLKVDKSFVHDLTGDQPDDVIAAALLRIAEGRGLWAIAKGVETAQQADRLHGLGYPFAQGFHFSHPIAAELIGPLLGSADGAASKPAGSDYGAASRWS